MSIAQEVISSGDSLKIIGVLIAQDTSKRVIKKTDYSDAIVGEQRRYLTAEFHPLLVALIAFPPGADTSNSQTMISVLHQADFDKAIDQKTRLQGHLSLYIVNSVTHRIRA